MPLPLTIVLSIIFGILIISFIITYGFYRFVFFSPRKGQLNDFNLLTSENFNKYEDKMKDLIISLMNRQYENIYISSFDKLKLHARLFENDGSDTVAILFHGYRGTAYRDFCGGANEAINMGYNVILVDHRAHGLSQGHSITFGIREVQDVLSWVNYAKNRFGKDVHIVLIGISMGGATVLMASDKVEGNVKIIADSPYSSPKLLIKDILKNLHLPIFIFYPLVNLSSLIFAHTNLSKRSAYQSIESVKHPILIIHGEQDTVVHQHLSYDLYQAHKDKIQYESFPGTDHGASYLADTARYQKIIRNFLK